jgi:hypothetical protein
VYYMLGGAAGSNPAYVAGAGPRSPRAPLHREASCWPDRRALPCTALTALLRPGPNPSVLSGALVAGPGGDDGFEDARLSPGARVGAHYNVPLLGALAGLLHAGVSPARCQGGAGFLADILPDAFLSS